MYHMLLMFISSPSNIFFLFNQPKFQLPIGVFGCDLTPIPYHQTYYNFSFTWFNYLKQLFNNYIKKSILIKKKLSEFLILKYLSILIKSNFSQIKISPLNQYLKWFLNPRFLIPKQAFLMKFGFEIKVGICLRFIIITIL